MDNFKPNKVAGVREAIQAAGAILRYLPPYSPDRNPIERLLFANRKALLRTAAERSIEGLRERIGLLFNACSPRMRRLFPPRRLRCKMTGTRSGRSLLKSNRLRVPAMGYR
jgi:transposase